MRNVLSSPEFPARNLFLSFSNRIINFQKRTFQFSLPVAHPFGLRPGRLLAIGTGAWIRIETIFNRITLTGRAPVIAGALDRR